MRGLICGPKLSACGVVLSLWGIIMLATLGIFFSTHAAVLIEDIPLQDVDIHQDPNPPQRVYEIYNQVGVNCFVAAGIYVAVGLFSCCQMRLNQKRAYLVQ